MQQIDSFPSFGFISPLWDGTQTEKLNLRKHIPLIMDFILLLIWANKGAANILEMSSHVRYTVVDMVLVFIAVNTGNMFRRGINPVNLMKDQSSSSNDRIHFDGHNCWGDAFPTSGPLLDWAATWSHQPCVMILLISIYEQLLKTMSMWMQFPLCRLISQMVFETWFCLS